MTFNITIWSENVKKEISGTGLLKSMHRNNHLTDITSIKKVSEADCYTALNEFVDYLRTRKIRWDQISGKLTKQLVRYAKKFKTTMKDPRISRAVIVQFLNIGCMFCGCDLALSVADLVKEPDPALTQRINERNAVLMNRFMEKIEKDAETNPNIHIIKLGDDKHKTESDSSHQ